MKFRFLSLIGAAMMACPGVMSAAAQEVDSLSMRTGMTDWTDPVRAVPDGARYLLYPSPQRGDSTFASCLVWLPDGYDTDTTRRYPVIYYFHGGTGNQREVRWLTKRVGEAVLDGKMEPVIIVAPQALPIGWYVNANVLDPKVTSGPIEDMIIKDMIPYIDANFRTIASREGRATEGFSMGGRGALMMAFAHPELFAAASSVAGAVVDWEEEPLQRALECTFGDVGNQMSRIYFDAWHPLTFACRNARAIRASGMKVRMAVGDADRLYNDKGTHITERFHARLDSLGIPASLTIVPGANHNPEEVFDDAVNPYDVTFWDAVFAPARVDVPEEIALFGNENFPEQPVVACVVEDDSRGNHYNVTFAGGTRVRFNEKYKWIEVQAASGSPVPASMVHQGIAAWLASRGMELNLIRSIEKVPRVGYSVLLSDGQTLLFDTKGELISESALPR